MMKAKGNSMVPRISEGDLVIARRTSEVRDGHVYVCVNKEECLIKTVRRLGEKVLLESFNREEYPIFEAANDFRVEGEVRQILSGKI